MNMPWQAGLKQWVWLWLWLLAVGAASAEPPSVPDHYIVVLNAGRAEDVARQYDASIRHRYQHALRGFAAIIPEQRVAALSRDARVEAVYPDSEVFLDKKCSTPPCSGGTTDPVPPSSDPQIIPTGIARIRANLSSAVSGDGQGALNVAVAVIDTGISDHPDLNVVGGVNCSSGKAGKYTDGNGHGTHVAGTIAARDNNLGVVGVAPGARLYAVRVLNNAGSGFLSDVICGIDWVTANAGIIDVANMSLGGSGNDAGGCASGDPEHRAICAAVSAGVTFVVAAGNESDDAANHVPAAYDEVITVSALADFDGLAGGLGSPTCRTDQDDSFADFSNFGNDVDILAPGVCITSTWFDGSYNTLSGTSMASPHVAGAAALYLSRNPGASPLAVKAALEAAGNFAWDNRDDRDSIKEPLLDVSSF